MSGVAEIAANPACRDCEGRGYVRASEWDRSCDCILGQQFAPALVEGMSQAQRDWIAFDMHPFNPAARRAVRNALIRKGLLNFDRAPPIFTVIGLAVRAYLLERSS